MAFNQRSALGFCIYVALIVATVAAFSIVDRYGSKLTAPAPAADAGASEDGAHSQLPLMLHVLLCLTTVVIVGNLLARVCRYIGQPPVIGEVLAGILLGPSLLGMIAPTWMEYLIPPASVDPGGKVSSSLKAIAQLGVVLYMFLVGLELDVVKLRQRAHATIAISHASIAIPFILGSILALWIYPRFSLSSIDFTSFALFCGIALSITAFPVLARILTDRKLQHTTLGNVALGCAAADDVTAWCLLAFVVGIAKSDLTTAGYVISGAIMFIGVMIFVVRPLMGKMIIRSSEDHTATNEPPMPLLFAGVLLCALTTEAIGIHSLFGAFLLGAIIPKSSQIAHEFSRRVKEPVNLLLLPAFFAYTGMRTQINMVSGWDNWFWCGVIILVATLGKFGGTCLAAKISGESWRNAAALGTLMNTRGLMELIVLNIGLDMGVITPLLFTLMVMMALVTTVLTSPVLRWFVPQPQVLAT